MANRVPRAVAKEVQDVEELPAAAEMMVFHKRMLFSEDGLSEL